MCVVRDGCMVVLVVYGWRGRENCVHVCVKCEVCGASGVCRNKRERMAWMRRDVVCAAWVWRRSEVCLHECGGMVEWVQWGWG